MQKILKLNFTPEENGTVVKKVRAGKFKCQKYRGLYDGGLINIWYSDAIPLYPVKIAIYKYHKEIELFAYGEDGVSEFSPPKKQSAKDAESQ